MRNLLALLLAICLSVSDASAQPLFRGKNSCMINAVSFQDAYNADKRFNKYRWSRVLCVFWGKSGHALCVFQYRDSLCVYDNNQGSWKLTRDLKLKNNPAELARLWSPKLKIRNAYYFD